MPLLQQLLKSEYARRILERRVGELRHRLPHILQPIHRETWLLDRVVHTRIDGDADVVFGEDELTVEVDDVYAGVDLGEALGHGVYVDEAGLDCAVVFVETGYETLEALVYVAEGGWPATE